MGNAYFNDCVASSAFASEGFVGVFVDRHEAVGAATGCVRVERTSRVEGWMRSLRSGGFSCGEAKLKRRMRHRHENALRKVSRSPKMLRSTISIRIASGDR
jgi:hypothetical protein